MREHPTLSPPANAYLSTAPPALPFASTYSAVGGALTSSFPDVSRPRQGSPEGSPALAGTVPSTPSIDDSNCFPLKERQKVTAVNPPALRIRIAGSLRAPQAPKGRAMFSRESTAERRHFARGLVRCAAAHPRDA